MGKSNFSRREFLGAGVAAAGASLAVKTILLDPVPAFASPQMAAADRVRFGIIGVGMQGNGLLNTSVKLPGVECAAACDLYDGRHELAKEIAGTSLPTTRRYQDLLDNKEIDCIIAAVPDHWHKKVVMDAVSAGKDVYCEKPMSHSPADGVAMVVAAQKSGRLVQVGSQRVSSQVLAKAKELLSQGVLGDIMLVETWIGRNTPSGAWQYPPPPDLSLQTLDWDTWQGDVPKRPLDPLVFARWRCWKEYGTGVAGDLLVHLMSGAHFMLGITDPPKRAMAMGGILRWKDGRNMPDVHTTLFDYGKFSVYARLNLGTDAPQGYRLMGSKGVMDVNSTTVTFTPQAGVDDAPIYYAFSFPKDLREQYVKQWHAEHDAAPGHSPIVESTSYVGPSMDDTRPHLWNFFESVRSRKAPVEDVVFGHHAALACHMANESYFRKSAVWWDESSKSIKS